jgi:hypothetical protein
MSQGKYLMTQEEFPQLDPKCVEIFGILMLQGELRFKDLKAVLPNYKADIPEATLLDHLRHLMKQKLVLRRLIDVKNVTYRPNIKKLDEFHGFRAEVEKKEKALEKMRNEFLSSSIGEQITSVLLWEIALNLEALKSRILFGKNGKFVDGYKARLYEGAHLRGLTRALIDKCLQDEEYRKEVFREIEVLKKQLRERPRAR